MTFSDFFDVWQSSSDTVLVNTSGSTGKPKLIELPKQLMRESAGRTNAFFGIDGQSRIHSCIAFDFIGGKMTAVRATEAGCMLSAETPSNRPTLTGDVMLQGNSKSNIHTRIDLLSVVPSQMKYLCDNRERLPEVANYLIGGAPLPESIRHMIVRAGLIAWESYGMTETASHIALSRVTDSPERCFHTLEDITVSLDSRECLVIDLPGSNTIVTNDIAELLSPTDFRIIGRYDNVIISGGKKFHPEQAEKKLEPFIRIPFYFSWEPDEKWGQRIVMICCSDTIPAEEAERELKIILERHLEHWQLPKEIRFIPELPLTANSKIKRRKQED